MTSRSYDSLRSARWFAPDDLRAFLQAAGGEGNIGGDGDVARSDVLDDPVVGGIGTFSNDDPVDQRTLGQAHEGVRHEMDVQAVPLGNAHRLVLDGARVGIDVDRRMLRFGFRFVAHAAAV